jgi:nitronate monooxygenase
VWPDRRFTDLVGLEHPLVQAPMAGVTTVELAAAVSLAGGLGSLGCAMLAPERVAEAISALRALTGRPVNVNFFCHRVPARSDDAAWWARLAPYYDEEGIERPDATGNLGPSPFGAAMCAVVETLRPEVVSFHFGLPDAGLMDRVQAAGCRVFSSATTVQEAVWLEAHGVDVVIAQGAEAGGHQGTFLAPPSGDPVGTMALVPQIADAVAVPVLAAGGLADGRGIAAAFALGAAGAQLGTAYLRCPEASTLPLHRAALARAGTDGTVLTNVFTGRRARAVRNRLTADLGPIAVDAPAFPLATVALMPLRAAAERDERDDFTALWAGQSAALGRAMPAGELTATLVAEAAARFAGLG